MALCFLPYQANLLNSSSAAILARTLYLRVLGQLPSSTWTCNFFNASAELSIFLLMDLISLSSLWDCVPSRGLNFFVADFSEEGRFLSREIQGGCSFAAGRSLTVLGDFCPFWISSLLILRCKELLFIGGVQNIAHVMSRACNIPYLFYTTSTCTYKASNPKEGYLKYHNFNLLLR